MSCADNEGPGMSERHAHTPLTFVVRICNKRQNLINLPHMQDCGNTVPDFSDLVPFHSGQVKNFHLLVLGQA